MSKKKKPYEPDKLPLTGLDYGKLITLVGEANAELAEYNGLLQAIINPRVMLSPLANQEAVLSSKIEGTQATVEEVLEHEAGETYDENKEQDIKEILNYRKALILAEEHLKTYPIKLSLILELHKILMSSVRGKNKTPGKFRKDQNWIGPYGCKIEDATFVPPSPLRLNDHLEDFERYMHQKDFDVLAQAAIVHAQFELLHPFKDGNGRLGRLLIPMFLFSKQRLYSPMFYLSGYLEANRGEYYERLKAISAEGDWTGWIEFFLNAVIEQAKLNNQRTRKIMDLYENTKERIKNITHSQHSVSMLDALFAKPIFHIKDLSDRADLPKPTVHHLIRQLKEEKLVYELKKGAGSRPTRYIFPELINIAEGRKVFRGVNSRK